MVFVAVRRSELTLDLRIVEALDAPAECGLPKGPRDGACSRRSWTFLAWKSSGKGEICGREPESKGKEGKEGWCGGLVGRQEEVLQTQTWPMDRTSFSGKTDGSALTATTKPGTN